VIEEKPTFRHAIGARKQSRRSVFIDPVRLIGIVLSVLISVPSAAPITAFEISR
jgi:hypothetical protein